MIDPSVYLIPARDRIIGMLQAASALQGLSLPVIYELESTQTPPYWYVFMPLMKASWATSAETEQVYQVNCQLNWATVGSENLNAGKAWRPSWVFVPFIFNFFAERRNLCYLESHTKIPYLQQSKVIMPQVVTFGAANNNAIIGAEFVLTLPFNIPHDQKF